MFTPKIFPLIKVCAETGIRPEPACTAKSAASSAALFVWKMNSVLFGDNNRKSCSEPTQQFIADAAGLLRDVRS